MHRHSTGCDRTHRPALFLFPIGPLYGPYRAPILNHIKIIFRAYHAIKLSGDLGLCIETRADHTNSFVHPLLLRHVRAYCKHFELAARLDRLVQPSVG